MIKTFHGGCSCGKVRFIAHGNPDRVGICHCLDCRKHHGAVFYAAAIYHQSAVTIDGSPDVSKGRYFCPSCGSSVFAKTDDEIELHLGSFDQPDIFKPTYECWTIRRESWVAPILNAQQFERDRS